ncbi:uncharacterized protein LOC134535416 isoform X2 [Bacillus rossius redtenbacheri]|uniref:uncharacterized protein LOC134535416 isoform X1 n=1 Tax=Bacillus rossius redtenbacheri TaxID=93214 RepID=UPI002FDEE2E1
MLRAPLGLRRGEAPGDSRPPSYCSRASSRPGARPATQHSREPEPGAVVSVISVTGADGFKLAPQDDSLAVSLSKGSKPRGHVVTIVQSDAEASPVIVTVSGSSSCAPQPLDGEMEILAHL